uniref:Nuclear receptor domain-containing protein n=1 Tax=Angiostrongylus cantonensis TaxID=6313 RepID=A0A0K0CYV4_ANGCA
MQGNESNVRSAKIRTVVVKGESYKIRNHGKLTFKKSIRCQRVHRRRTFLIINLVTAKNSKCFCTSPILQPTEVFQLSGNISLDLSLFFSFSLFLSQSISSLKRVQRSRVAQWSEVPCNTHAESISVPNSPPSLLFLRGRQIGTRLVWKDSSTGSIHRQATASHCDPTFVVLIKACAAFFRRTVSMNMAYLCAGGDEQCRVHFEMRNICRLCRLVRCVHVGMRADCEYLFYFQSCFSFLYFTSALDLLLLKKGISVLLSYDINLLIQSALVLFNERTQLADVIESHVKLEIALNDRRRIMYTDIKMKDLYMDLCEVPYQENELRQFDYRKFQGLARHDFVMLHDYFNGFLEFDKLTTQEKNLFFRYACAVDCMITSAYFTYRLGRHKKRMVMFNGEFLQMDPLPIRGDEPGAEALFNSKSDYDKYRLEKMDYFGIGLPTMKE